MRLGDILYAASLGVRTLMPECTQMHGRQVSWCDAIEDTAGQQHGARIVAAEIVIKSLLYQMVFAP